MAVISLIIFTLSAVRCKNLFKILYVLNTFIMDGCRLCILISNGNRIICSNDDNNYVQSNNIHRNRDNMKRSHQIPSSLKKLQNTLFDKGGRQEGETKYISV